VTPALPWLRSGLLIPLFSCPSTVSWGIGDIGDIKAATKWLAEAGQHVLQLLPLNEMARGRHSPYSAISALAIDPLYITMAGVPDFTALGGESALDPPARDALAAVRASGRVDYTAVRLLKRTALRASFGHFHDQEWRHDTPRALDFRRFLNEQRAWLDDYALFRALHAREGGRPWMEWSGPLRSREPGALAEARGELAREILFYQYLQWIADTEWQEARRAARANGVALFGDLPFMVDSNSADVWTHQESFRLDASVGVPPDAFSATGQDWGMPLYRWKEIAAGNYVWLRQRAARSAALFDGFRVDHLVGFYRTFARPLDGGDAFFTPAEEEQQVENGEAVLQIMQETGAEVIAEDLGIVPDFVRASLERLGVPGYRVLRWERRWNEPGQPFRDTREFPRLSVATTGTHDTEPAAVWWDTAPIEERRQLDAELADRPFDAVVRDRLLERMFAAGSKLVILPVQDVFGWRDRINVPATVNEENWKYRLPWPIDRMDEVPEAQACRARLRAWSARYGRDRKADGKADGKEDGLASGQGSGQGDAAP
jgi:4-alpha-glucanotransferase